MPPPRGLGGPRREGSRVASAVPLAAAVLMTTAVAVLVTRSLEGGGGGADGELAATAAAPRRSFVQRILEGGQRVSTDGYDSGGGGGSWFGGGAQGSGPGRPCVAAAAAAAASVDAATYVPPATADGRLLASGPSPWDELPLDVPYDEQSRDLREGWEEGEGGNAAAAAWRALRGGGGASAAPAAYDGPVFRHMVADEGCPVFVLPSYHDYAGMGHRFSNYVMGLIAALTLDATMLFVPMDYRSKPHGDYAGLDAFLGVGAGEWTEAAARARWPNLTVVDLPRMDNYAPMARGGMFSPNSRVSLWLEKRAALSRKCHVM